MLASAKTTPAIVSPRTRKISKKPNIPTIYGGIIGIAAKVPANTKPK